MNQPGTITSPRERRLLLAITGASGAIYARQFLDFIRTQNYVTLFVVASLNASRIFKEELGFNLRDAWPEIYSPDNFDVSFVSGSAKLDAMVIMPCSMGTLGRIAHGISNDAITRAADVFLKEKRPLVIVPRETPFNLIHLKNLTALAEAGGTIIPAMPSFYSGQKTIEDATLTVVARVLDHLDLGHSLIKRWKQNP